MPFNPLRALQERKEAEQFEKDEQMLQEQKEELNTHLDNFFDGIAKVNHPSRPWNKYRAHHLASYKELQKDHQAQGRSYKWSDYLSDHPGVELQMEAYRQEEDAEVITLTTEFALHWAKFKHSPKVVRRANRPPSIIERALSVLDETSHSAEGSSCGPNARSTAAAGGDIDGRKSIDSTWSAMTLVPQSSAGSQSDPSFFSTKGGKQGSLEEK